jgi:endonuclease
MVMREGVSLRSRRICKIVKNLHSIEPGLRLYEEEGLTGVQFSVGGRFIDILAVDRDNRFVVIELKVSRGYDRVIGQLLRYMGWVEQNLESAKSARGIIVAKEITDDLKLACSRLMDVKLIEYELSFTLRHVEVPKR